MILCFALLYSNKASFAYAFANVSSISLLRAAFQIDFGPILRCLRTPKIVILLRTSLKSNGFHFVAIRSAWIASPNPRPPRLDRNFEAPVASRPSFCRYKQKQRYSKKIQNVHSAFWPSRGFQDPLWTAPDLQFETKFQRPDSNLEVILEIIWKRCSAAHNRAT